MRPLQERLASEFSAERGHETELVDGVALVADLNFEAYDACIIAASVHQEYHQEIITNFVIAHLKVLEDKPSAFISVSLSAVLEEKEAQRYVDKFVAMTGWRPRMSLLLGGALRFTEYDYFQEQIVKFIVMKRGDPLANMNDREFTDWDSLMIPDVRIHQCRAGVVAMAPGGDGGRRHDHMVGLTPGVKHPRKHTPAPVLLSRINSDPSYIVINSPVYW
jgi:menaquinone-dependent protoporphyrinogen oxidase